MGKRPPKNSAELIESLLFDLVENCFLVIHAKGDPEKTETAWGKMAETISRLQDAAERNSRDLDRLERILAAERE